MQGMLTGKEFPQQEWQEHLLWKTRGQNQNNMFMLYKIKRSIWIESWNTHIHQRFVFFTVLEKIKSGVHVRLLQDEIVRIYRENMMFCLHILSAAKNNGLLPLTQKDIAYIWRWLSCVLSASSRSSPRRCEEGEVLPAETLATVCHAWCRCTRPSALLLGSSCSGKSSLFWRGIQQDQELFKQTNKQKNPGKICDDSRHYSYFFRMGMTGFKMASNMFMRMEFPAKDRKSIKTHLTREHR